MGAGEDTAVGEGTTGDITQELMATVTMVGDMDTMGTATMDTMATAIMAGATHFIGGPRYGAGPIGVGLIPTMAGTLTMQDGPTIRQG
jgi:hypothetical protein